ncbi:regulator of nonsense transcripts 2-like isoform X2 [Artemia franciscana]|uniref:Regulator of nonsense transcripts 2 n=1 Tax=Artemia franciscana TaxID=6661 RepID=A0AA88L280_ARTSF|nr:hypothetical protein QYM36_011898 [Artemia franciscana]
MEGNNNLLEEYILESTKRLQQREALRCINLSAANNRPDESVLSRLDSNLKKNTAFVRKLKNYTESQRESILKDCETLNLSKYIGEISSAICETKIKIFDIPALIEICSVIHRKYADFGPAFLESWQKSLSLKKDSKISNLSKFRVDLRFYAELISAGIFTLKDGLPLLGSVLTTLVQSDKEEHSNISILLSFCKACGDDFAGLVPYKIHVLAEEKKTPLPQSDLLPLDKKKNVRQLLKDYYASVVAHVMNEYRELQSLERQARKILNSRGELSPERKEALDAKKEAFDRLFGMALQFSEAIEQPPIALPENDMSKESEMSDQGSVYVESKLNKDDEMSSKMLLHSTWDDEETRQFYESLPDLKGYIPHLQRKIPLDEASKTKEEPLAAEIEEDKVEAEIVPEVEDLIFEKGDSGPAVADDIPEDIPVPVLDDEELDPGEKATTNKILLDSFLSSLPNCVSREKIDSAAVEFAMALNTRYNRKRLVRSMFTIHRTRLDLLPFYGRFAATLYPYVPDVALELVQLLKHDFKYHVKKKDQINIETKVKVVRFIGELVKFGLYPKSEALSCLRMLLFDFTYHHIEMACNMLETCGKYLFHSPETHQRTKVYLDQIMRKKSVIAMDSRYTTMIENAYYQINPPEFSPASTKPPRPPIKEFLRKLIYTDLSKVTSRRIIKLLRRWNWEEKQMASYGIKVLSSAHRIKYMNIKILAGVVAELFSYQEGIVIQIIDSVLEDIRLGIETNIPKLNQRRIATAKFLAELYNYRLIDSGVVFKVLYALISFGVSFDPENPSEADPPDSMMRLRLACTILETCGIYFTSGISKKRLDYFLTYLQHYYWVKKSFPIWGDDLSWPVDIEHLYQGTLYALRPKLRPFKNLEKAEKEVDKLEKEFLCTMESASQTTADGLTTIRETAEEEELYFEENEEIFEETVEGDEDLREEREITLSQSQSSQPHSLQEDALQADPLGITFDENRELEAKQSPEDEDFLAAYEKILTETNYDAGRLHVKSHQSDIAVPYHLKSSTKKTIEQITERSLSPEESKAVSFVLMTRKGNKPQYKNLTVSVESDLAKNLINREMAERMEKEKVKRLTLDINERQEEEDYMEQITQLQRPSVTTMNRERKPKYQHPKGTPDADLIFGSKKSGR